MHELIHGAQVSLGNHRVNASPAKLTQCVRYMLSGPQSCYNPSAKVNALLQSTVAIKGYAVGWPMPVPMVNKPLLPVHICSGAPGL